MTAATADLTALANDLSRTAGLSVRRAAELVVRTTAQNIQQIATSRAPRATGVLAASIRVKSTSGLSATIGPTAPYGVYQEFGTASRGEFGGSPYVIRARNGRLLAFSSGGATRYARSVTHPGVRPQPYMRPALVESLGPMTQRLAEAGALAITSGTRLV